jgi:hypothetical protein
MRLAMSNGIYLQIAESKSEKTIADNIVIQHHSYVSSAKTVGRVIKYLIWYENRIVGTFWIGSGFKPTPKAILNYFQKSQSEFDKIFNEVADNKRFAMAESIPNLGSQILKAVRHRARNDWFDKYGNQLSAIVTTIGDGKNGAVYLADNWQKIGETAGLPSQRKSVSMKWNETEEIKERFVKPTGENKKVILITTKLQSVKQVADEVEDE